LIKWQSVSGPKEDAAEDKHYLRKRSQLISSHSSLPAIVQGVECRSASDWIRSLQAPFVFLLACVAVVAVTFATISCSNGVFLVAISGMVQAYAAWAILLYTEQLPTDSACFFAVMVCAVMVYPLLLLTVYWPVQAAACCCCCCCRCLSRVCSVHGRSTCMDAAHKRKEAVLQSGSQVSDATQAATAAAADAVVAEGFAAAIRLALPSWLTFMADNDSKQAFLKIRQQCSPFLKKQLAGVAADDTSSEAAEPPAPAKGDSSEVDAVSGKSSDKTQIAAALAEADKGSKAGPTPKEQDVKEDNASAAAAAAAEYNNAMLLLCLLSELGVPLHSCFNPFCSRLFKNRFSLGNILVHFSTMLAVLLFTVFVILAGVQEPFYTRGIGMCLGRCGNRPDCWSNITLELPTFDMRPICPGEGRFPYIADPVVTNLSQSQCPAVLMVLRVASITVTNASVIPSNVTSGRNSSRRLLQQQPQPVTGRLGRRMLCDKPSPAPDAPAEGVVPAVPDDSSSSSSPKSAVGPDKAEAPKTGSGHGDADTVTCTANISLVNAERSNETAREGLLVSAVWYSVIEGHNVLNEKGGPLLNTTAKTNANGTAVFTSPPINASSSDGCNITVLQPSDGVYVLDMLHSDVSGGKLTWVSHP
jgi:hypothetical protein